MAILDIVVAPDVRLETVASPVERVDDAVRKLMDDMVKTMYFVFAAGLAAPQVGVLKRVIVMDINDEDRKQPLLIRMANPEIVWASEELDTFEEGCLSIPDILIPVTRPARVKARYLDENNIQQEIEADHYLAKCIQHEIDHLNGICAFNYLSPLKKALILKKLKKYKRNALEESSFH